VTMPRKKASPAVNARASSRCRNCGHSKEGHERGSGPCLFTTEGEVPIEVGAVPFTRCPCKKFGRSKAKSITAEEVSNILGGKELVVSHPHWYTQKKQPRNALPSVSSHMLDDKKAGTNSTKKRIDAFIQQMSDAGYSITRTDIWRAADYNDATEFERFQREDSRTTSGCAAKFSRILDMTPEAFMEKRAKQRSS